MSGSALDKCIFTSACRGPEALSNASRNKLISGVEFQNAYFGKERTRYGSVKWRSSLALGLPSPQGRMLGKAGKPRAGPQTGTEWEGGIVARTPFYCPDSPEGSCPVGAALWSGCFRQWLSLANGPVAMVGVLEEVPTVDVGTKARAGQENP